MKLFRSLKLAFVASFFFFAFFVLRQNAHAQTVTLFADDAEQGVNGWIANGETGASASGQTLWHQTEFSSSSPVHSWYYGLDTTRNYDTGERNWGTITSTPISIPAGTENIVLQFRQLLQTENSSSPAGNIYYDVAKVEVSNDGAIWNTLGTFRSSASGWEGVATSIPSYYLGDNIQIRFSFDTVDNVMNNFQGWLIDDITITGTTTTPTITPTLTPTPTPTPTCGQPAQVSLLDNTTPQIIQGGSVNNTFEIYNPNDIACGPTLYGISHSYPGGWSMSASASALVNAGETKSLPFALTSLITSPAGTYSYTIWANGGLGATGYVEVVVLPTTIPTNTPTPTPTNTPPTSNAGADQTGFTNQTINFNGTLSGDAEGPISYLWNFGDGASSTVINPTHIYASPGTYNATLLVTDQEGLTAQDSLTVTIANDAINITKATYSNSKKQLTVEATSNSNGLSLLNVQGIGPMIYDPVFKVYRLIKTQAYVASISVTSTFGGSSTSPVTKVAK